MLLFKELKDCLFLLLIILITVIRKVIEYIVTDYNVLFDIRNFYDQPIKNQIKKYNKFRKTVTGQGDHHTTVCLFHYVT